MTTMAMTVPRVPQALQRLIDSRLDTIDRMLLGRLPRGERLEIVREVESQIFELLAKRSGDEPTRDDVLTVLARLDPPEAYLADEAESRPTLEDRLPRERIAVHTRPMPTSPDRVGISSTILGLAMLLLLLIIFPLTIGVANFVPGNAPLILTFWYGLTLIALTGSITAIVLAARSRLRGGWAIAGLVIGIFALLGTLGFAVLGIVL
jgi:hypothetical protein